ncbi:hypothetical protein [Paeniglutamicibacter gangotriensis]|uniref:Uncharacterized protein n=1 Tax=Paeniglutamicibacter gangotriensis Lz1y TaxID=1276920 RepID=M7N4L6_9MICC|nr:hypothetical protein [Paeniglutamicibacter gangotriensis]EMQ96699.1 hypothetical protein ADIAG_04025 [Paeniglutamicibacter gangotriensis Lz1y]
MAKHPARRLERVGFVTRSAALHWPWITESRAEGVTRLDPVAFGRFLGTDRSAEVKTIRRQHHGLVDTGKVPELMSMIAFERFEALKGSESGCIGVL